MQIIAAILVLALLYWLWPLFLALAFAGAIYFVYKTERKRQVEDQTRTCAERNLAKVDENITGLKSNFVGVFGAQKSDNLKIIKITDIKIEQRLGKKCLSIVILRAAPDNGEYQLGQGARLKFELQVIKILEIGGEDDPYAYSLDWLVEARGIRLAKTLLIALYDEVSVEARLSELLFLNNPEIQWALSAINKIENALAPVSAAYNI